MATSSGASAVVVLDDLKAVFGPRLEAFVTYAPTVSPAPSLALVTSLDLADLGACAARVRRWQASGAATPVVLTRREFARSLDAFPVEFGEIITHHQTLHGDDPFAGMTVAPRDLRRACESQIRSLLLHIREDYMEAAGSHRAVAAVVLDSSAEFRALLGLVARLAGETGDQRALAQWASDRLGLDGKVVSDVLHIANELERSGIDAARLFPQYLAVTEQLARHIDEWPDQ
jgi:hypothetical protein